MVLTTTLIAFISGSVIGAFIGNQVTQRSMRVQRAEEFEYWIGTFEDEEDDMLDLSIITPECSGFNVVPVRISK